MTEGRTHFSEVPIHFADFAQGFSTDENSLDESIKYLANLANPFEVFATYFACFARYLEKVASPLEEGASPFRRFTHQLAKPRNRSSDLEIQMKRCAKFCFHIFQ